MHLVLDLFHPIVWLRILRDQQQQQVRIMIELLILIFNLMGVLSILMRQM